MTTSHQADDYDAAQPDPRKPERGPGQPPKDGEPANHQMQFRITASRKGAYVRAARARKQSLRDWAFANLDTASGYSSSGT